jgi:anaerobic magnesium-protoporphyrin IX monomethyl ester cyclase
MACRHALCLYPYTEDQSPGVGIFPPTGLEHVATALKGHAARISLIDLRHERQFRAPAEIGRYIRSGIDLVCVSLYWRRRYAHICDYINALPPDVVTVVGGPQATENVEDVLRRCAHVDALVRGEGEQTIQEVADGRPWDQILGLSYRRDGRVVHNPNRPLQPIGQIAPPDRSLRRSRYVPVLRGMRLLPAEYDTVLGSRGCPYRCKFCTLDLNPLGQKREYSARTPESVVDEIAALPARNILFSDDNFFLKPQRVERICDLLLARGIDKRYFANARIEVARHPQMLAKAYRAGFRMLLLGIESASDRILHQMDKGFTTQQVREAFAVLRRFSFYYHAYFIYGNVGETAAEMLAIPDYAQELGVHSLTLSLLHLDRFTPLRKVVESTPGYWLGSRGHVYSTEIGKPGLLRIRNQIRNRFVYRPGQLRATLTRLNDCEILTYGQLARLSLASPLFLYDYLARRAGKAREHRAARRNGRGRHDPSRDRQGKGERRDRSSERAC